MRLFYRFYYTLFVLTLSLAAAGQNEFSPPVRTSYNLLNAQLDTLKIDTVTSGSQIYHPLYKTFPLWHELGNLGFPALTVKYNGISKLNEPFYLQTLRQYANPENRLIQYQTNSPYALLSYTSGGSKDINGQFIRTVFARPVAPGIRFTSLLDFIISPGHYKGQNANQSSFSLNLDIDKGKYLLKVGLESLKFNLGENGGIVNPSDLDGTAKIYVPISLGSAASSTSWTIIQGRQEYDLFSSFMQDSTDSISIINHDLNKDKPTLFHFFRYQLSQRLYKDAQSLSGTFYDDNLLNNNKTQDSVSFNTFINRFGVSHSGFIGDSVQWMAQAGLFHVMSLWYVNELNGNFQQIGVFGNGQIESKAWKASIDAKIQLLGYGVGSYKLDFDVQRNDLSDAWDLNLGFTSEMEQPSIFYQIFSGNHDRWYNSMRNQHEQSVSVSAKQNAWNLSAGGGLNLISNWVYFDKLAKPQQTSSSTILGSAYLEKEFRAGHFRSKNMVLVQYTPAKEIPLPLVVASTSTFMHHDLLFPKTNGRLELEYGIDLRYCTSYQGYAYRPSTGAFYLQDQNRMGNYPYLDIFLIMRVKRTRIFVKWEHINAGFTGGNYFPVLNYPLKERFLKYGVYWHFYD